VPHLRDLGQAGFEARDRRGVFPVHGHLDQHLEAEPDRGGVDDGPVPADRLGSLQLAKPPVARRHAERDPLGEFGDGEAPLLLELGKHFSVYGVHDKDYCREQSITA
jgi:hypothetical protein